jgi:hypothetical protein
VANEATFKTTLEDSALIMSEMLPGFVKAAQTILEHMF